VTDISSLIELIGANRINQDASICRLYCEDIADSSENTVQAVVTPADVDMVASVVQWALQSNVAVIARGGGMSYTAGYLPTRDASIMLDMTALKSTIEIDQVSDSVTVDAGCTWSDLYDALAKENLRTPFFGPLSGLVATVGGAVSQNAAFFGSARYGTVREHVLGMELVDDCGRISWIDHSANPVLTGIGCSGTELLNALIGDAGALGIKTRIKLRTIPTPVESRFASFVFDDAQHVIAAMEKLRSVVQLAEVYAFDQQTHLNLARGGFSLQEAPEFAKDLVTQSRSVVKSAVNLIKGAALSKVHLKDSPWSLHVAMDLNSEELFQPYMDEVTAICTQAGGRAISDTIPRVTRARPFRPIKALIGPDGERWLPCHGVFDFQQETPVMQTLEQWMAERSVAMQRHNIRVSTLLARIWQEIIIEPQFFWPDALSDFQRAFATPRQVQKFDGNVAQAEVRHEVHRYRAEIRDLFAAEGAGFMQLGKYYPHVHRLSVLRVDRVKEIKMELDPRGILNPED
jgi:FAD/FMN-containing dehydrogenase